MKVFIEVDKGASEGTRYEIDVRSYRAVGRAGGKDVTVQLTNRGDRMLDPDDLKRVEEHLARRQPAGDSQPEKMRIGAFRRGRDILVDDEKVSRTHAMIFVDEDGPSVVDLLSTNGSLVNGAKVGDADLRDGDILHFGETRFVIRVNK